MLRSRIVERARLLMSTSNSPIPPQRLQFRLRSILIFTAILAVIAAIDAAALRAKELGIVMFVGRNLLLLFAIGAALWAAIQARRRGLGGWRLILIGAAAGAVLGTIAYAPIAVRIAQELNTIGRGPRTPTWVIASAITLQHGIFGGAVIGAITASLTFARRFFRDVLHELRT